MSNVEQGISNEEVRSLLSLPSAFVIHYSTCPLCPQRGLPQSQRPCGWYGVSYATQYDAGQAGILRFGFERLRSMQRSHRL